MPEALPHELLALLARLLMSGTDDAWRAGSGSGERSPSELSSRWLGRGVRGVRSCGSNAPLSAALSKAATRSSGTAGGTRGVIGDTRGEAAALRGVSQTPWLVDGGDVGDGSVQDDIEAVLLPLLRAESAKVRRVS